MPSPERLGERFGRFAASLTRPLVFFDIEATGTDPLADRIVEIATVRVSAQGIEPARSWRIDPRVRIPVEASEIHGITNRDLEGAPCFADVADEIADALRDADLAGFSITRFDVRILAAEFARAGKTVDLAAARIVDAQVIFHQREPRNLGAALQFYRGRELHDAHGALADTIASLEVFAGQLDRYDDLDLDVAELHAVSTRQDDGYCDGARRFVWRDHEPAFNFGRLRGKSLRWVASDPQERNYLRWFVEGNFEADAKDLVRAALRGKICRRGIRGRSAGA
jgi:DNA polymerase-3 subunit epsilon